MTDGKRVVCLANSRKLTGRCIAGTRNRTGKAGRLDPPRERPGQ